MNHKSALSLLILITISPMIFAQVVTEEIIVEEGDGNTRIKVNDADKVTVHGGGMTIAGDLSVSGNVNANNVEAIKTFTKSLQLSTSWQDTGISGTDLENGTHILQIFDVTDHTVGGGHFREFYSGLMSWYGWGTNSPYSDEIPLHRAGLAPNWGRIYLRTKRDFAVDGGKMKLQIKGSSNNYGNYNYVFKFKKML